MSSNDDYVDQGNSGIQPMVLYRDGTTEYNVMMGRGMYMYSPKPEEVKIYVGSYANNSRNISVSIDNALVEPKDSGLSLIDKIRLRFNQAAKTGGDIDLRFCTGQTASRKPEQDSFNATKAQGLYTRTLG